MRAVALLASAALIGVLAWSSTNGATAAQGQDQPAGSTCTCKKCGTKGKDGTRGDVTGKCNKVCKGKTVFSKGSEANDYCKAAAVRPTTPTNKIERPPLAK